MAIKTFTTGEVLTASDTNTYLANAGLTYVTSGTLAAAGTIFVNNCFTSTYDHYKIIITELTPTTATEPTFRLRASGTSSTANYYWSRVTNNQAGLAGQTSNGNTYFAIGTMDTQGPLTSLEINLYDPFRAIDTKYQAWWGSYTGTRSELAQISGFHNVQSAFDGFSLTSTATTISAKYVVYGFRKA